MASGIVFKFDSMVVFSQWKSTNDNWPKLNHVLLLLTCVVHCSLQAIQKIILHLIYLFVPRISSTEVYVVWESTKNKSIGSHHAVVDYRLQHPNFIVIVHKQHPMVRDIIRIHPELSNVRLRVQQRTQQHQVEIRENSFEISPKERRRKQWCTFIRLMWSRLFLFLTFAGNSTCVCIKCVLSIFFHIGTCLCLLYSVFLIRPCCRTNAMLVSVWNFLCLLSLSVYRSEEDWCNILLLNRSNFIER